MAFPYTFEQNFETGSVDTSTAGFDGTGSDANSVVNIRHWRYLGNRLGRPLPYRGAYCLECDIVGSTTNQYLAVNTGLDIAADGTLYVRFLIYVTTDLTMAASDRFTVFALQSAGPVDEAVIDIRNNAGTYQILASETGASATVAAGDLILGQWHTVELFVNLDDGGSNDGTLDFYLDGHQIGAQITALDQAAVTQARLGIIGKDAGTTAGKVYISELTADDARLYPYASRHSNPRTITKSQHLFVGPGSLQRAALASTAANNVVRLWDTDTATMTDGEGWLVELTPDNAKSVEGPVFFRKGCYVQLSGTEPKAALETVTDSDYPGVHGPATDDTNLRAQLA